MGDKISGRMHKFFTEQQRLEKNNDRKQGKKSTYAGFYSNNPLRTDKNVTDYRPVTKNIREQLLFGLI